ncbi:hypothetical protein [uncultured Winogradskyella sp.]|uniref:hypothetical protein n=1 Tax=uncultured Winogradskyella sp. TaxID=395353 RepID=UPI0030D867F7|tara:strand:+ start:17565 stop:18056 length:492 start_codon:yes stop_codon:yes gene_type:complete
MILGKYNTKQKKIYFRAYKELSQLENALKHLKEENTALSQVSILGKVAQFDTSSSSFNDTYLIKTSLQNLLGKTLRFGTFNNPESGSVFIAGALVTTFLHKINGKSLATLSSGSYGIFRGIGVSELQATTYLKLLNTGSYLLILRGCKFEIEALDTLLSTTDF